MSIEAPATRPNVSRAADALRRGHMVLVVDPLHPQRGGVVAAAAEHTSDDIVNFMATHARGLVALAMPPDRLERLALVLQGPAAGIERENYCNSIEAKTGVSTGISAADRARTIQVAVDPLSHAEDLVSPGHVFPIRSELGGVLVRAGWAEATTDLVRIAGLQPAATLCQVLDAEGELARGRDLFEFAHGHGLVRVAVAELIAHRMATESYVTMQTQATLPTAYGDFLARVFRNRLDGTQHVALTVGDVRAAGDPVLVRLHSECLTGDIFGSKRCDCGPQLAEAMRMIAREGRGVILYLRQEGRGIGLVNKLKAYKLQEGGQDTVQANLTLGLPAEARDFSVGAKMLLALGVTRVRLLTNNPRKINALADNGVDVVKREALEVEPTDEARTYLRTKKDKMGHLLSKV